jgi:tryptophanyl-tRNA synthetase
VRRTDLVVPVGADQQQMLHVRVRDQVFEEVERCYIQPLQRNTI